MSDLTKPIVREATMEDAPAVIELLKQLGLIAPDKEMARDYWNRHWDTNPSYKLFPDLKHAGWVLEHEGKVVGTFGQFLRLYYLHNKPVPVIIPTQWAVEKPFRKYIELLCEEFFYKNVTPLKLATTAIKPSANIIERHGGRRVAVPDLDKVFMVPFNISYLIRFKLESSKRLKFFAPLAELVKLAPWKWQYKKHRNDTQLQLVDVANLPPAFNTFWEKYRNDHAHQLVASRDPEELQWFYKGDLRNWDRKVFMYVLPNGTVTGYASMMEEATVKGSFKRYKILDLLADDSTTKTKMISALIRYAFLEKADVLEFHLPGTISKKDIPAFTLTRQVAWWPVLYQSTDAVLHEKLKDGDVWHISPYDGDTALG